MFEKHFHLHRRPFTSVPSCDRYFAAASIDRARAGVVRMVEREQGPGVVIGATGTGKTMLCGLLDEAFQERYQVVRLPTGRLSSRRALLQTVLYELGQSYRDMDEGELRLALIDHATDKDRCPEGIVILVDEAENLAMPLMDELRTMTDLMSAGAPCIRLVLLGNTRLEEKFAHPRLESFNQRIAGRFYLDNLDREESRQYVHHHLSQSGAAPEKILSDGAYDTIYQATEGIPRLINQLCDHALVLATVNGVHRLEPCHFDLAWADLQQLPMPKLDYAQPRDSVSTDTAPDIVEFGLLDDDTGEHVEETDSQLDAHEDNLHDEAENPANPSIEQNGEPEVALILHNSEAAHDPFDEAFENEEVVIDHFITPDAIVQPYQQSVTGDESRVLADALDRALSPFSAGASPTDTASGSVTVPATPGADRDETPSLAVSNYLASEPTPEESTVEEFASQADQHSTTNPSQETGTPDTNVGIIDRPDASSAEDLVASRSEPTTDTLVATDTDPKAIDSVVTEKAPKNDVYRTLFTRFRKTND